MGVHCEINLFKPPDGSFVPGSTVSGIIKYSIDEETVFNKIAVCLKGYGWVVVRDFTRQKRNQMYVYRNSEDYVNIDNVVHNNEKSTPLQVGSYELPFNFTLPQNIPASLDFLRRTARYRVRCVIHYNVCIKFQRPGLFNFDKQFKKDITVVSGIKPRLPIEPTIYGEQKKLFQLFSRKQNIVNIKANIESCVIKPGGKVNFNYEIFNLTNINLKSVETKLVEVHTFTTKGHQKVKLYKDIDNTDSKTGAVNNGESQNMDVSMNVPSDIGSLEYSNLVSRDYFVYITAEIPFPHTNATLEIPLQIGDRNELNTNDYEDPPPSYWEAMSEDMKKDDGKDEKSDEADDDDDDGNDEGVDEKS